YAAAARSATGAAEPFLEPEPVLAGQFVARVNISNRDVDIGAYGKHGRLAGVIDVTREIPRNHEMTLGVLITKLVNQVAIGRRHRRYVPRRVNAIEVT